MLISITEAPDYGNYIYQSADKGSAGKKSQYTCFRGSRKRQDGRSGREDRPHDQRGRSSAGYRPASGSHFYQGCSCADERADRRGDREED